MVDVGSFKSVVVMGVMGTLKPRYDMQHHATHWTLHRFGCGIILGSVEYT